MKKNRGVMAGVLAMLVMVMMIVPGIASAYTASFPAEWEDTNGHVGYNDDNPIRTVTYANFHFANSAAANDDENADGSEKHTGMEGKYSYLTVYESDSGQTRNYYLHDDDADTGVGGDKDDNLPFVSGQYIGTINTQENSNGVVGTSIAVDGEVIWEEHWRWCFPVRLYKIEREYNLILDPNGEPIYVYPGDPVAIRLWEPIKIIQCYDYYQMRCKADYTIFWSSGAETYQFYATGPTKSYAAFSSTNYQTCYASTTVSLDNAPDSAFANANYRKALLNKLNAVDKMIDKEAFNGAHQKLVNDIEPKIDTWIVDPMLQNVMHNNIDYLIEITENPAL